MTWMVQVSLLDFNKPKSKVVAYNRSQESDSDYSFRSGDLSDFAVIQREHCQLTYTLLTCLATVHRHFPPYANFKPSSTPPQLPSVWNGEHLSDPPLQFRYPSSDTSLADISGRGGNISTYSNNVNILRARPRARLRYSTSCLSN